MECCVDGSILFYQEYGTGKPVLCLHGFPEDHKVMVGCLEPLFQSLEGYRRIYLDLPGMGKSPATANVKNADDMLRVINLFLDKVIADENFLLIGQSYGGYLSLGLLRSLYHRIDGMFLICPCVIADNDRRQLPPKKVIECDKIFIETIKNDKDYNDFIEYAVIANQETWERYRKEILSGLKNADVLFTTEFRKTGYAFSFCNDMNCIDFHKPVCVLSGRQDDCVGYMDTLKLINNFSRATFMVIDGAGHNLQIERSNIFNMAFIDWIDRVRTL